MFTKEEIVKAIQKIAREDRGHTPPQKKFQEITGIIPYELSKYWGNYGELCTEAGLSPNIFDKTKFNREYLCRVFTKTIREKGRWPRKADLQIKHLKDSKFPASVTFYKQLGLTGDLAQTILEYIKDKRGYEDVASICNSIIEKYKKEDESEKSGLEQGTHGWVYLIRHGNRKEYRIGKATNLLRRLGQNKIELPERAIPIHSIETADITGVETYWLNKFKPKGLNGDWFSLTPSDVKEFKRWKKIY